MIKNNNYICEKLFIMSLNKFSISVLFMLFFMNIYSQSKPEITSDTIKKEELKAEKLDKVIITHKDNVMSLSKKIFSVIELKQADIKNVAANNLADLLTQNLNITITPDPTTGRSTIDMFDLGSEYSKVLIDGIPVVSDNGVGNNIDITQLNLEDIERVEIVEGASGVLYGDNALAGVINIVTKRKRKHKWQIQASLQEESVGDEYNLSDKGRHIQNFKIANNLNKNISYALGASRNDFKGFYNTYKGKDYINIEDGIVINDGLRGTEWSPKEQLTYYANANVSLEKHHIFYKFQYFDESVTVYDRFITGIKNDNGTINATANDEKFNTDRVLNNLVISGPLVRKTEYNLFFSQQNQKRYYQNYTYNILEQGVQGYNNDALSQSSDYWFSKGFVNNIVPESDLFNLQLGYEFTWQKGFDAIATGSYSDQVVVNKLNNYDLFGIADFNITKKWSVHPGARLINNSQFGNKAIWSLSTTNRFSDSLETKAVFGSAFRAPSFSELFFYFVDANHNVQGNPDLQPEDGISILLNISKYHNLTEDSTSKTLLKGYYFDINSKIASIVTEDNDGKVLYTFANIDNSKTAGLSIENTYKHRNISIKLGTNYIGKSNSFVSSQVESNDDFLWRFNAQANVTYKIPSIQTILSGQIKYTGKTPVLLEENDVLVQRRTDSFTWFDASIRKDFTKYLNVTLGARNILNVITVNATDVASAGHDVNAANSRLFGNGRSYFLKLLLNLNFN